MNVTENSNSLNHMMMKRMIGRKQIELLLYLEKIIINAIMHYVNCTREDAEAMHYGVRKVRNDYYSAFMEDGKLVICENGFPIHRLILI